MYLICASSYLHRSTPRPGQELDAVFDPEERHRKLVQFNAIEQVWCLLQSDRLILNHSYAGYHGVQDWCRATQAQENPGDPGSCRHVSSCSRTGIRSEGERHTAVPAI